MRVVEDLPLVPTTWIDAKAPLGRAQHGHHAPHAVEPEAHPEELERAQVALGPRAAPGRLDARRAAIPRRGSLIAPLQRVVAARTVEPLTAPPARCAAARASRARAATTAAGARSREAGVGELALDARDLALELRARRGAAPLGRGEVEAVLGEHLERAARDRDRGRDRARRIGLSGSLAAPRGAVEVEAREVRERRVCVFVAVGAQPRGHHQPGPRTHAVAPAADQRHRLDHCAPARPRPRGRSALHRRVGSSHRPAARPYRPGSDHSSSVTNGITGCASATVSRRTYSSVAASAARAPVRARSPASVSEGLPCSPSATSSPASLRGRSPGAA